MAKRTEAMAIVRMPDGKMQTFGFPSVKNAEAFAKDIRKMFKGADVIIGTGGREVAIRRK